MKFAEATGIITQEPLAKRQRTEVHAANMREHEVKDEFEQLRKQNRQQELQLQLAAEKQAAPRLQKEAELQLSIDKQAAMGLAQKQDNLQMRQMMWNVAQCGSHFTDETIANSAFNYGVQPDAILCVHTPFVREFKHKTVLLGSNAAIC